MGIVGAVGVVGDAAAFVGGDLVLVDDPFKSGAIAKAVFVGFGRDVGEGQKLVVGELSFVLATASFSRLGSRVFRLSFRSF